MFANRLVTALRTGCSALLTKQIIKCAGEYFKFRKSTVWLYRCWVASAVSLFSDDSQGRGLSNPGRFQVVLACGFHNEWRSALLTAVLRPSAGGVKAPKAEKRAPVRGEGK
ncbi:hypothetical protein NH00_15705 [Enterobacter cancerogenus]|nr:hypothetical protein NH00_15705 [Enterobacter cancerogenus]